MTPQKELEIRGNFFSHPFAELLTEIMQARLNGSLRGANKEKKWVIYFVDGKLVFAVSNAREARLFDILMRRGRITKDDLTKIPNFANDFELTKYLQENDLLSGSECDQLFVEQIQAIIVDILSWKKCDWSFSSLTRIRDGLEFDVNAMQLIIDYARCLPPETVLTRFRSLEETFIRSDIARAEILFLPEEEFILARAERTLLSAADLVSLNAMTKERALQVIYTLWAGGLLVRRNWQPAFTESHVSAMNGARLELIREAKLMQAARSVEESAAEADGTTSSSETDTRPIDTATISVEEYLARVENAETYYDILDVDINVPIDELKRAYFRLARNFHPDRYHAEGGETLKRVQRAFTELAQAHETLKNETSREMYDYRMRKEIADREKHRAAGTPGERDAKTEQAVEHFDRGLSLLMEGEAERALPFFARAVHFAPDTARFRAYYGKALSTDGSQRHKAESEMQAALRMEPDNPTFRIMLAEFFIQNNLRKRAEGELNRLLALLPDNRDALNLLEKLRS